MSVYELSNVLSAFADAGMFFLMFEAFLKRRQQLSTGVYVAGFIILALGICVCNYFLMFQYMNALGMMTLAACVSALYIGRFWKRLLAVTIVFLISLILEMLVVYLVTFIMQINVTDMILSPSYRLLGVIIAKISGLAICNGIRVQSHRKQFKISKDYWLAFFLLFFSFLSVTFLLFRMSYALDSTTYNAGVIICTFCLFMCIAFSLFLYERQSQQSIAIREKERYEQHLTLQLKHLDDLLAKQNELRKFKHDLDNQLIVLRGYLENGDVENGLRHVADLTQQVKKTEMAIHTGNTALDAILSTKKSLAESHGIVFQHVVRIQEHLPLDPKDLCIIFGNALDNAIEACDRLPEGSEKRISLTFLQDAHSLSCNIENTAAPSRNRTLATSKADKENHGFGVQNITETLAKHDSAPIITQSDDSFSLGFVIFLRG